MQNVCPETPLSKTLRLGFKSRPHFCQKGLRFSRQETDTSFLLIQLWTPQFLIFMIVENKISQWVGEQKSLEEGGYYDILQLQYVLRGHCILLTVQLALSVPILPTWWMVGQIFTFFVWAKFHFFTGDPK